MSKSTRADAALLLKLYELRRDPEMRRARTFMISEFTATSWDEIRPHYLTSDEIDRHFRMATSYWEMVAAFVNRGLVDETLFFDTNGEDIVIWNKIKPLIPEARRQIRPTYLWNLEQMARRHIAWRERTYPTAKQTIERGAGLEEERGRRGAKSGRAARSGSRSTKPRRKR